MSKERNRREIIKLLGLGSGLPLLQSPLFGLIGAIVNSNTAVAADSSRPTGLYLNLWYGGGPFRYDSDLLLTPYDEDLPPAEGTAERKADLEELYTDSYDEKPYRGKTRMLRAPSFGTSFVEENGEYVDVYWKTIKKFGLNVPPIWGELCPKADGTKRPMTDLLQHLFNMRGIFVHGSNDNSHGICAQKVLNGESGTAPAAMAALYGAGVLPGIGLGAAPAFGNPKNLTPVSVFQNRTHNVGIDLSMNCIKAILAPFISQSSADFLAKRAKVEQQLRAAYGGTAAAAEARNAGAGMSNAAMSTAREIFNASLDDLANAWAPLYNKYEDLARRGLDVTDPIAGISDKPVVIKKGHYYGEGNGLPPAYFSDYPSDLRNIIGPNTRATNLAAIMATAEYMFTRGLTNSIFGDNGGWHMGPLNRKAAYHNGDYAHPNDEHNHNRMLMGVLHAHYNRALFGCMLELKDRLADKGLWERTVINVNGEMGRMPRNDIETWEHGHAGNHSAFYCGALTQPMVLGNIWRRGTVDGNGYKAYRGTWGCAAPIDTLGVNYLDVGHYQATLASLLNVPSGLPQKPPVVVVRDGRFVPTIEKAKIVGTKA